MKRIALAALLAVLGMTGIANAQGFGVYIGPDHPYYRHHHHWRDECRVVIRSHINRWGNRVTVRERICD
jgi:hypothetical protein